MRYFKWLRAAAAPVALHRPDKLRAARDIYWKMIFDAPHVLLHGDAHVGNSYIGPDNSVSFLDWQGYGTGYWMHDVPYFLVGALDLPDRRANERDLLQHYLSKRAALGARLPKLEEVWDDYRRAVIFGFITWLGNEDTWQLPETNMAQFARFSVAMIDHEVFRALGV
ncbi:MAG: phosphotransferase [Steroidobacteraceae bacterium]